MTTWSASASLLSAVQAASALEAELAAIQVNLSQYISNEFCLSHRYSNILTSSLRTTPLFFRTTSGPQVTMLRLRPSPRMRPHMACIRPPNAQLVQQIPKLMKARVDYPLMTPQPPSDLPSTTSCPRGNSSPTRPPERILPPPPAADRMLQI